MTVGPGIGVFTRARWRAVRLVLFLAGDAVLVFPLLNIGTLGADARLYVEATIRWLGGGDPWQLGDPGPYHFSGLPPTVLSFVPFAALPPGLTAILWVSASTVAAIWTLRRLDLGWEWLLFPPMLSGAWFANPDMIVLALLLSPLAALAPILKVYAAVPLAVRGLKPLVAGAALGLVTIAIAPELWSRYLSHAGEISARLIAEAGGGWSTFGRPPLFVLALALVAWLAWRREWVIVSWLAIPLLWPAVELHYWTMALPVVAELRRRRDGGDVTHGLRVARG